MKRVSYKCLHCTLQSMSVVSSELRIGTLERWISHGLWLLDTVCVVRELARLLHFIICRFAIEDWERRTNPLR